MPRVEVSLDQLVRAIEELSPGELETLEILLNPELGPELKERRVKARKELEECSRAQGPLLISHQTPRE